jgi:hypothetical protein
MFGHIRDYFADIFGTSEEDKAFGNLLDMFDKVKDKRAEANQFINENVRQPMYEAVDKVIPMELLQMGGGSSIGSSMPPVADARAPNAVAQLQSVMANAGIQNPMAGMLKPPPVMTMQAPEFAPRAPDNFMPINPMDAEIGKIEDVVRSQEVERGVLEQPNQATPGLLETTNPYTMGI